MHECHALAAKMHLSRSQQDVQISATRGTIRFASDAYPPSPYELCWVDPKRWKLQMLKNGCVSQGLENVAFLLLLFGGVPNQIPGHEYLLMCEVEPGKLCFMFFGQTLTDRWAL
jgi:hypothetical protein